MKILLAAVVAFGLLATLTAAPSAAYADDPIDPVPGPTVGALTVQSRSATAADFPVIPAPGKSVVIEQGATSMTVATLAAGCTISMTAAKPYVYSTSPRRILGRVSLSVSTGCSEPKTIVGKLEIPAGSSVWTRKVSSFADVGPGASISFPVFWSCTGSGAQTWRTSAWSAPAGIGVPVAASAGASLACGA